jgi:UDP-3-O-[3-hydroxymyristoyl] glucosamine N-acyltransferase
VGDLASHVGGEVVGNAALPISGVSGLSEAKSSELSFFANPRYRKQLKSTQAGAVLVPSQLTELGPGPVWIRVSNPHLAFAKICALFYPRPQRKPGVDARASVHEAARVHPTASVLAGACIEAGAQVGARTLVYPGAYIGERSIVGDDCILYPNCTIREDCQVGSRVILHSGCVIGADGFGFAFDASVPEHFKVPQVGTVRIEDDVEVGACTCVDRAATGETVIGRGSKIDNLVQIAHNVRVGPLSIVCAQAGVSGSSELGSGVVLAGQVGVVGHIKVGDMARVGAQSGVAQDVPAGATISGTPAIDHRQWLRVAAVQPELGKILRELRELRSRVQALMDKREA